VSRWYGRDGKPIATLEEWASRLETDRRVAETHLPNHWVSTVWLGLDYRFGDGPPLIFETMVFRTKNGKTEDYHDLDCERYSTEAEALAGHEAMVEKWKNK